MSAVLETCLWHGSDWIAWIDRSGDARPSVLPLVDIALEVKLTGRPPRDLTVVHKPGRMLLWRLEPETLRRTETGEVPAAARLRPDVAPYALEGELADPSGQYLPRRFALDVGTAVGHPIPVYRAPVNVRFQSAGGLHGRAVFADGRPAAWAVIEVTVTPPLAGAMPFVTQADARGEFRLALNRLPALTRDAPVKRYNATVRVRASAAATGTAPINPDLLPAVQVTALTGLKITPGRIDRLHSTGSDDLVLQSNSPPTPPIPPGP